MTLADIRSTITPSVVVSGEMSSDILPKLTGTIFSTVNYTDRHFSTDWQIALDSAFTSIVAESLLNSVDLVSWKSAVALNYNTMYYARVRYHGEVKTTEWSAGMQFKTVPALTQQTIIYTTDQVIDKPAGITQMRIELVGGGGTGNNRSYGRNAQYLGGAGQYVDSGWLDVATTTLPYSFLAKRVELA